MFRIDPDTAPDFLAGSLSGLRAVAGYFRLEPIPLRKRVEYQVIAVAEQFIEFRFLEGGRKDVHCFSEFFESQSSFIERAGRNTVEIPLDQGKDAEHGKAFERHEDLASGPSLHGIEKEKIPLQGRFIEKIARGGQVGEVVWIQTDNRFIPFPG